MEINTPSLTLFHPGLGMCPPERTANVALADRILEKPDASCSGVVGVKIHPGARIVVLLHVREFWVSKAAPVPLRTVLAEKKSLSDVHAFFPHDWADVAAMMEVADQRAATTAP